MSSRDFKKDLYERVEMAVQKRMPNWWPRCYATLLALVMFRGKALPYELREYAESRLGLSYRTLLRGLNKLRKEGLVYEKDSFYVLEDKVYTLMIVVLKYKEMLQKEIEDISRRRNIKELLEEKKIEIHDFLKSLMKRIDDIVKEAHLEQSEVIQNLKKYLEIYTNTLFETLCFELARKEREKEAMEILRVVQQETSLLEG